MNDEIMNMDMGCILEDNAHIEYVVNEEKRTVTAILFNTANCAIPGLIKMDNNAMSLLFNPQILAALFIPEKVVGTARCAEGDEFDVEVGKKIAKKKMLTKFDRLRTKAWYRYRELLEKRIEGVNRAIKKYYSDAVKPEDLD